jgi:transforming growth factor-beta-induced protein
LTNKIKIGILSVQTNVTEQIGTLLPKTIIFTRSFKMKKISVVSLSLFVLFALVLAACAPAAPAPEPMPAVEEEQMEEPMPEAEMPEPTAETEPEPMTIVDVAVADGRFTTLAAALGAADLVETLQGDGPFTVFAPTDDAFAMLPEGTVEALLGDIPALTEILLYHVVSGEVMAADVVELSSAETVGGMPVKISVDGDKVMINGVQVIITDVMADNGVIHVIDSVLLPPGDIVDVAVADGRFNTLATALTEAGLVETLKGEGPFTVFAPTDDAFAMLPEGTIEALLADIPTLTDILLYHVAPASYMAGEVIEMPVIQTAQGGSLIVQLMDGKVMINGAEVIITDVYAKNGVIHVIDSVLLPQDIVDTAVSDGRFNTLATALTEAGLVETLKGEGPFTVFAPTDDAFAMLPEGTIEALLADIPTLSNILLYHVVAGDVRAADVVELESADTVLGAPVSIKVMDGKVYINDSQVIIADIVTTNGVIHVIDAVLLPPDA